MADVRFTVLGRVALTVSGAEVPVRGRRERSVLALLLAARRRVVSVDRLVEDVWGDGGGDGARGSLHVAVSRLRALMEPDRAPRAAPQLLVSGGPGYALLAPAGTVDAELFTSLVDDAHAALAGGGPEQAAVLCDEAAALWTGSPFGDAVDSELVRAEVARLEDLRVCALELRAEALLALGRHALLTGELEALVAAHPFRERLWELHALALYRSGRQGDALGALRRARDVLVDELGVDPSPALQRLEADVLAQSPRLEPAQLSGGSPAPSSPAPVARAPKAAVTVPGQTRSGTAVVDERPKLVGRSDAVALLETSLHRVRAGSGETVVVSGEAGIGKTRLVTELAATATAQGARVFWGRCHESDVSPAYWPWVPVVRELADGRFGEEVAELLSPTGPPRASDADSAALRTYDAVSRLLAAASGEVPLVVVLEDLHWADASSLRLLSYAAEALRGSRVLLVATVRASDAPSAALQACLAALGRLSAVRVPLRALSRGHVRDLVGQFCEGAVDDELAAVIAQRTDGNPFFVIELVRLLAAEQRLDAAGAREVAVPHGVQDVLRLRLARLPEVVRHLLSVAAVLGREFELDVLAEVSVTDPDDTLNLLDEAVRSHAVEEEDRPGHYRFTHALLRETLAGSLSLARRGRLHAAIAVVLEPRLPADPDLVAEVAYHFLLGAAMRPELAEPAVRHAVAAARLAEARDALDEALQHWEQALTADGLAPTEDLRRRYDVLLGLGRARYRRGEVAGSREALDAAVDVARRLGDIALIAAAATSFRGAGVWHWREFGTSDPAMVAVLEECITALPPGALHARALASLAMELTYEWRSADADIVGRRAVDAARAVGDDALFADVVSLRTLALWGRPGAADERLALAEEVLALPLSYEQELYTRFGAAAAHLQRGDTVEADRQMTRCIELARRLRHTGADVPIAWWRFHRALDRGDDPLARQLADEALERHRRSQMAGVDVVAPMVELRLAGAGAPVPDGYVALAQGHANPAFRAFISHALSESGRHDEAVAVLGAPVPDGAWDYASIVGDCLRVDVLACTGRSAELRLALDRIAPWGHEFGMYGSTDCIGCIDYFIGRGLEGLGDFDGARAAYERAVERNRTARVVPWLRRAERRLAALLTTVPPAVRA